MYEQVIYSGSGINSSEGEGQVKEVKMKMGGEFSWAQAEML